MNGLVQVAGGVAVPSHEEVAEWAVIWQGPSGKSFWFSRGDYFIGMRSLGGGVSEVQRYARRRPERNQQEERSSASADSDGLCGRASSKGSERRSNSWARRRTIDRVARSRSPLPAAQKTSFHRSLAAGRRDRIVVQ